MILGTAVKVTSVITVDGGGSLTSVKISIWDSKGNRKVNAQNMTLVSGTTYSYIYQSASTDEEGRYKCIIDAVSGSYTGSSRSYFQLDSPTP